MRPSPINRSPWALLAISILAFLLSAFVPFWPAWIP